MDSLKAFEFDIIDRDTPIKEDNSIKWYHDTKQLNNQSAIDLVCKYLDSLGFVVGEHKVSESDMNLLCSIAKVYLDGWIPDRTPFNLESLFTTEVNKYGSYWLRGNGDNDHYYLSDKLIKLLEPRGLIYELSPDNYYFEIIQNRLYIKYQHIIGSRKVCYLKVDDNE